MYKVILVIFINVLIVSCATKTEIITNIPLMQSVKPVETKSSHPKDFEKSIPQSIMIRNSLVSFSKSYQKVYTDSNVISFAAGKNIISVLKENEIGFTMPYCSGLLLKEKYSNIRVYGYEVILYNGSNVEVFSASECASVGRYKRLLNGFVELVPNYIIEWVGSNAVLRNSYNGDILYKGDTGINIISAGYIDKKPALLQQNNYLLVYNDKLKSFVIAGQLPSGYTKIHHQEGMFYGILEDNKKFFVLDNNTVKISDEKDCRLSNHSVSAICGNTLITDIEKYHDLPKSNDFAATSTSFINLDKSNIQIYYLETLWQRFLSMSYSLPKACRKNNILYYKSFSGSIYKQTNFNEEKISSIPKNCSSKNIVLNYGDFYCGGKKCGKFSSPIKNNEDAVMYRRIEDNVIYYYFDNLKK